jgi:hypothetical protein
LGLASRGKAVNVQVRGVARGGVEPPTFRFSVGRSYQLSYLAVLRSPVREGLRLRVATPTGLEPATSAVTGRRANQLRYGANVSWRYLVLVLLGELPCWLQGHCVPPTGFEPALPP